MILMKIQFILEAYVYRHGDKDCEKNVYGVFFWIGLTYLQVLCHYGAVNYFQKHLNQVPKLLSRSFYNFRIEKD